MNHRSMTSVFSVGIIQMAVMLAYACRLSAAQVPDEIRRGSIDFGVTGGGIFGLGTHPVAGGSVGIAASKWVIPLFEVGYAYTGADTFHSRISPPTPTTILGRGYTWYTNGRLLNVGTVVHILPPVKGSLRPYAAAGVGSITSSFTEWTKWDWIIPPNERSQGMASRRARSRAFDVNLGGGFRWYVRRHWGLRPDFRLFVRTSNKGSPDWETRSRFFSAEISLFYRLK